MNNVWETHAHKRCFQHSFIIKIKQEECEKLFDFRESLNVAFNKKPEGNCEGEIRNGGICYLKGLWDSFAPITQSCFQSYSPFTDFYYGRGSWYITSKVIFKRNKCKDLHLVFKNKLYKYRLKEIWFYS